MLRSLWLLLLASILLVATSAQAAEPLVVHVVVPLCSNEQIDCGSNVAGDPDRLDTNLYWGAAFGHRRFFDRKKSGFSRVDVMGAEGARLERVVYRRNVSAEPFGGKPGDTIEQIIVLDAYHGDSIDRAVEAFWRLATRGGRIRFRDGGNERDVRISVAGYAGHNRLMDGVRLSPPPGPEERARAIPSFVLACDSEPYFGPALRAAGSETWLMTRSLMAPEGYVLDAVVTAIGEHASPTTIRERAVAAYAKWQKLSHGAAGTIFAKPQ
ncbi:hypothetical protein [Polyangium sorediatum]|uniref:Uncharacterized protein n=1 Tax=Polyangium sorediatum TaxID=889274 RepID=A0ABT6P5Z8_9BACT|nr:hypothetical protein [Polyangium sorediatum]MDI1435978.1 hypothetical protein [Polyangium sorediatum]